MPAKVDVILRGHRQLLLEDRTVMERRILASIRTQQGSRCTQAALFMDLATSLLRTASNTVTRKALTMAGMRNIHLTQPYTSITHPARTHMQLTPDMVTCSRVLSRTTMCHTQVSCLHTCSQLCLSAIHERTQAPRRRTSARQPAKPQHGPPTPPSLRRWQ